MATTSNFIVSTSTPMDLVNEIIRARVASTTLGIGGILASTTASLANVCLPFTGGFNIGDCLTLLIYPGDEVVSQQFAILRNYPPWGYGFRLYDLFSGNATTSTTTMPVLSYTAGTSSMLYVGNGTYTFDPFGTLLESGSIVNAVSDQVEPKTVWEILEPVIKLIVYLMLGFIILNDLLKLNKRS